MKFSELFEQEFLDLAGIDDGEIKGILEHVNLEIISPGVETKSVNYFEPRYLSYVPFISKPFDCSEKEGAIDILKSCINQLEIIVINCLDAPAKARNGNVELPEDQHIYKFDFNQRDKLTDLFAKVIEGHSNNLICVSSIPMKNNLSSLLSPRYICGAPPLYNINFVASQVVSDDKFYVFEDGKIVLGCFEKFKFYCRADPEKSGGILCQAIGSFDTRPGEKSLQAIGSFDAVRFDERSVIVVVK